MDKRLFFLLNMAQKKLFRHVDAVCERELDASVTQLAALMLICQQPGCLQKDLAQALELNKSAVTGLIGRMEKNGDRKSTRLNSSHVKISYAVFCLKKKTE